MPAEEFPKLYEEKGEELASFKKRDIEGFILRVVFAAASDSSRPALSGMLIDEERSNIVLVATMGLGFLYKKMFLRLRKSLRSQFWFHLG